jgi:hypothetical protein
MQNIESPLIGGKTIEEWDRLWTKVEGGLKHYHPALRHSVGLYRLRLDGQIVVIGTGTDLRGGLAKRLSDFIRPGSSGRNYPAGERIYTKRDRLEVEVLITGSDSHAQEIGRQLKTLMIERHRPPWTAPARSPDTFKRPRKRKPKRAGPKTKPTPYTGTIPKA